MWSTRERRVEVHVPRILARQMAFIARETGVIPEVSQPERESWLVTMEGDRIRLEAWYRGPGAEPAGATIWVDGREIPFTRDQNHFIDVWRHPDIALGAPHPVPKYDGRRVPAVVQHAVAVFTSKTHLPVEYGFDGCKWVIGLTISDDTAMRLFLTPMGKSWGVDRDHPFQLVIDGQDATEQYDGQIDRALAALARAGESGPAGESHVTSSAAKASNAVTARRHSVIRNLRDIITTM